MQACSKRTDAVPIDIGSQKGQFYYKIKRSLKPLQSLILSEVRGGRVDSPTALGSERQLLMKKILGFES